MTILAAYRMSQAANAGRDCPGAAAVPAGKPTKKIMKKTKVAIVYDDPAVRGALKDMLDRYSEFEVDWTAGTKAEATSIFRTRCPELLFLGLRLPDGNGLQVLDYARETCPCLYTVIFTSFYPYISRKAFSYGEDDYLLNPFSHDDLDRVLRRCLAAGRHEDSMASSREDGYDALALRTVSNELMPVGRDDIAFFRYDGARKLWDAVISESVSLPLRKGTTAKDILQLSPVLRQCHQSFIVNLRMVRLVGLTQVRMCAPFAQLSIPIGRTFCKTMQESFKLV